MTTDARHELVQQIIQHEGLRLKPYTDTVGKLTIGVGRNLSDKGISASEAATLLDHDLDECIHAATKYGWFLELNEVRQAVIVDLLFNLGEHGFSLFRHFIAAMARGNYPAARLHLLDSTAAKQNPTRYARLGDWLERGSR